MAYREVRIREERNKLAFRFDPERDLIEVMVAGQRYEVALEAYRPARDRRRMVGVDFDYVDGERTDVL